jgi:glucosamine 6-phosphate synthetase-like amidotransferase/phosphosugar isomerase protein
MAMNPYSFVKHSNFKKGDTCIHFTQEAKRNDNFCPLEFSKKKGGYNIIFTSKINDKIKNLAKEIYWYSPEVEKILVASMSYVSGYVAALKYLNFQLLVRGKKIIQYDTKEILKIINKAQKNKYKTGGMFTVFLYAGYSWSVALEGALKANECFLEDSEAYEIKHYSHGKHFVSWNQNRIFNVLLHKDDEKLIRLYQKTIFEKHHKINLMISSLPGELAVFEWMSKMLAFTIQSMAIKKIELEDISIRDKIKEPHNFKY